ncbi:hypothetical protein DPM13_17800 [Paracoccus mutanolyticus]|uniref:GntR C-terminal domain-containing protein n=1 Tax=Paracoccus mutanolyticus TaxID=1499308 RepID=A0ABM6WUF1_9RHOB|nr:FCD domain-containing protein [Paracoccus mutanolyticus]AWX94144.1 hypothetical protein DPM13_17800 [Paracoccus mutanolyticus]
MGALEALAGELACLNITDKEIREMQALHDRMLGYYRDGDLENYFAANQRIHEALWRGEDHTRTTTQHAGSAPPRRRAG